MEAGDVHDSNDDDDDDMLVSPMISGIHPSGWCVPLYLFAPTERLDVHKLSLLRLHIIFMAFVGIYFCLNENVNKGM